MSDVDRFANGANPMRGVFPFRPWVRRAGLSIVAAAAALTALLLFVIGATREGRFGWAGEPVVWVYIAVLWIGGLKVLLGTWRPVAEADDQRLVVRPLHQLWQRAISWESIRGTEQMIGGDRFIVYYDTQRGMRFVALNLNLVKGRREFLAMMESRLQAMGFVEKLVERSRYLTRDDERRDP